MKPLQSIRGRKNRAINKKFLTSTTVAVSLVTEKQEHNSRAYENTWLICQGRDPQTAPQREGWRRCRSHQLREHASVRGEREQADDDDQGVKEPAHN
jgi:hypothetical protein